MAKPQWLKDREQGWEKKKKPDPDLCCDCSNYGDFVKFAYHKGKERVEVHACSIHGGCLNTKYSICCSDFIRKSLI